MKTKDKPMNQNQHITHWKGKPVGPEVTEVYTSVKHTAKAYTTTNLSF